MLIIVQNDPEVPPGIYADFLVEYGISFRLLKPYAGEPLPSARELRAAIVLGGAMGVHDTAKHPFLAEVKRFILETVEAGVPYLGICLGGQLLADVLDAPVTSGRNGEKGTLRVSLSREGRGDPLFAGVSPEFVTFQWHSDTFAIPAEGILLASSPACPNQAFRVGPSAYGTQFHPEVNRGIVDAWARWTEETVSRVDDFVAAFAAAEEDYRTASRRILANFLRIAGLA